MCTPSCTYTHTRAAGPTVGLHRQTNTLQKMWAWWHWVALRSTTKKGGHTLFLWVNSREETLGKRGELEKERK